MTRSRVLHEPTPIPTMHPELFVKGFKAESGEVSCVACYASFAPPTIPAGWAELEEDGMLEYYCPACVQFCRET